ncbi:MAG: penicillin-insensitive murein endopeptidase [Myxococcota bacterium]
MLATALGIGLGLLAPSLESGTAPVALRYVIRGGEQKAVLAERYGTTQAQLSADNPGKWSRGRVLNIAATRRPVPVQKLIVTARERDSWATLASRYGVGTDEVRRWNPRAGKRKRPRNGQTLVLWLPSGASTYPLPEGTDAFPVIDKPTEGESIGRPNRGRLEHAARLPPGPYIIRFDWQCFGSALAVWNIQRAIGGFRAETGFDRDIFVGALSRRSGRRLPPHRSHQSGRDVDVRLPAMPHATGFKLSPTEVDWHATWALVDAFVRTDDVAVIFLERKLRTRLRYAGIVMGASDERLDRVMGHVRHSPGHTAHIHIRFRCDEHEERCKD